MTEQTPLIDCDGNEVHVGARVGVWPTSRENTGQITVCTVTSVNYLQNCAEVLLFGGARESVPTSHLMVMESSFSDADLTPAMCQASDALVSQIVEQVKPGGAWVAYATGSGVLALVTMRMRERLQRDLYLAQREHEDAA